MKSFLKGNLFWIVATALLTSTYVVYPTVMWDNTMAGSVTDEDLIIDGMVQLGAGGTSIRAITTDINVMLMSNSVVRGNDNAASQLYICAESGRTIDFMINMGFDLTFQGSSDMAQSPLLIIVGGLGTVNFQISGDRTISFTKVVGSGGTQVYVLMQTPAGGQVPLLNFMRETSMLPSAHATVNIGEESLISYIAPTTVATSLEQGCVSFDPANTNTTGRLILNIEDTGGFIIAGSLVDPVMTKTLITLSDIDRTIAAGQLAIAKIENTLGSGAHSGLLVTNRNETQFELLIDPFGNLGAATDGIDYNGAFTGTRYGFVLGANATLEINDEAYLDYVGLANNECPTITPGDCPCVLNPAIKERNPSAFFVDGNNNPLSTPATINIGSPAGMYFRSGVDSNGGIKEIGSSGFPFTVTPLLQQPGAGNYVFDVEGPLSIFGLNTPTTLESKIEILSLAVYPTGGPLFMGGTETNFPRRSFEVDCGLFVAYNKAAFLINNCLNLIDVGLVHTDENHAVCENDDIRSEPTYVGGEAFRLDCFKPRPKIAFCNSQFLIHTDVAFTGLDLLVTNKVDSMLQCSGNLSQFVFYSNGKRVDCGTGRQFILGTVVGSKACDGFTSISPDAHLDILQTTTCANDTSGLLNELILSTSTNDSTINPCITTNIGGQTSIHTIFLGNSSNITIGTDPVCCGYQNSLDSELKIAGNFFSFESRGGPFGEPEFAGVCGRGVIFVDANGIISIGAQYRASISTMIVKREGAQINLPKEQIFFDCRIGITDWKLDLATTQTLVELGQCLADYTLNWLTTHKDYDEFCPYEVDSVNSCTCPTVQQMNVTAIPVVRGTVNQFQVQGSRIGDPVHIKIDCGYIRELVFQKGCNSAEAPVAMIVLQNEGRVGLGSAHRNPDSLEASIVMGVNGVTIIANGSGQVDLNEDLIVNNTCSILKGPDFVTGQDVLRINSPIERALCVTKTGILDLRSFGPGDIIEFCGDIRVIMEPGAKILMNGCILSFADQSVLFAEPLPKTQLIFDDIPLGPIDNNLSPTTSTPSAQPHNQFAPLTDHGLGLGNTDEFRVKLIGTGEMRFVERSSFLIPKFSFVGVETLYDVNLDSCPTVTCEIPLTDLTISFSDNSSMIIGDVDFFGGSFQVGNTADHLGHSVSFQLLIQGISAEVTVREQGFMGFGVGIVDKRSDFPNGWLIDNLFNVSSIFFRITEGGYRHDRIFGGNDLSASLLAISEGSLTYTIGLESQTDAAQARANNSTILGGGNMALVFGPSGNNAGAIAPIIQQQDGVIDVGGGLTSARYQAGVLASRIMLENEPLFIPISGTTFFEFLKVKDFNTGVDIGFGIGLQHVGRAVVAPVIGFRQARTPLRTTWVLNDAIGRDNLFNIDDAFGGTAADRRQRAAGVGAVAAQLDQLLPPPGGLAFAQQIS